VIPNVDHDRTQRPEEPFCGAIEADGGRGLGPGVLRGVGAVLARPALRARLLERQGHVFQQSVGHGVSLPGG